MKVVFVTLVSLFSQLHTPQAFETENWPRLAQQKWATCSCYSFFEPCMDPEFEFIHSFEARCIEDENYCANHYRNHQENPEEYGPCNECDRKTEKEFISSCSDGCQIKITDCRPWCETQYKDYAEWFSEYSLKYYGETATYFCDF